MSPLTPYLVLLIAQLGDPSFRVREEATVRLSLLGEAAHRPLMVAKLHHDDPEVRMRARVILEDWRATFRTSKRARTPLIDCLPDDYPDRQLVISGTLQALRGCDYGYDYIHELEDWPIYRSATELLVDQLIVAGKSKKEITLLLDAMVEKEATFWRNRNMEPLPN